MSSNVTPPPPYRVGRKTGRAILTADGEFVALCERKEDAAYLVKCANEYELKNRAEINQLEGIIEWQDTHLRKMAAEYWALKQSQLGKPSTYGKYPPIRF